MEINSLKSTCLTILWGLCVISMSLGLGAPGEAYAQGSAEMEAFEAHLAQAASLLSEEEFEGAISELDQARAIIDHPRLAMRVADAYRDWGRCARAEEEYLALLERDDLGDEGQARVQGDLEGIAESCVEHATLRIRCEPAGARLSIDGQEMACPFDDDLVVGRRDIDVQAPGYEPYSATVEIAAGEVTEVDVGLVAEVVEPPPTDWISMAGYGAMGLGAALVVTGAVVDYRAGSRTDQVIEARQSADQSRLDELESQAGTARVATFILYGTGAVLVATGAVVTFGGLDFGVGDQARFSAEVSLGGVSATLRW